MLQPEGKIPGFYGTKLINCLGKLSMIISWLAGLACFFRQHSLPLHGKFLFDDETKMVVRQIMTGMAMARIVFLLMVSVSFLDEVIRRNVTEMRKLFGGY
jgi:hypothetical protein